MRKALISLLAIQVVATLAIAGGFYAYGGAGGMLAALYGGGSGVAVSLLLALRLSRAARPGAGVAGLYLGALERFVFVAAAFALAFAVLGLEPIPLLAGFAGAELAYYAAGGMVSRKLGRKNGG